MEDINITNDKYAFQISNTKEEDISRLFISAYDRTFCEEYTTTITDADLKAANSPNINFPRGGVALFNSDVSVLRRVIYDGIAGKTDVVRLEINKCSSTRVLTLNIFVNLNYAEVVIQINLAASDKSVTPTQVMHSIDYKLGQVIPQINIDIAQLRSEIDKCITNAKLADEVTNEIKEIHAVLAELKKVIAEMKSVENDSETSDNEKPVEVKPKKEEVTTKRKRTSK